MNRSASRRTSQRITAGVAAALVTLGVLASGEALNPSRPEYLADYGSNQTAEISGQDARDAGVRHDSDVQHGHGLGRADRGGLLVDK